MAKRQKTQAERDAELRRSRKKARNDIYPFPKFQRECALLTEDLLYGEIYIAENLVNGKQYCGKTEYCAEHRWCRGKNQATRGHVREARDGSDYRFHKALRKYGSVEQFYLDGFKVSVIFQAKSADELNEKEKQVIAERDLMNHAKGYNMRGGGDSGSWSDDVREKLSKSGKEWWDSLTETEREERSKFQSEVMLQWIASLSEEEARAYHEANRAHGKAVWEAKSDEEKLKQIQRIAKASKLAREQAKAEAEAAELKKMQDSGFLDFFDWGEN